MMRFFLAGTVGIIAALGADKASAEMPLLWCNGCTAAQKVAAALGQPTNSTVYVADTTAKTVYAYWVYLDVDDGVRPPRRYKKADRTDIDPVLEQAAMTLINFYDAAPQGWEKRKQASYDGPDNGTLIAYDVVNDSPARNAFLDWASHRPNIIDQAWMGLFQIAAFKTGVLPSVETDVYFWDGSKITLKLNIAVTDVEFSVAPNSGKDSHGNTILSKADDEPHQFSFIGNGNPADKGRWAGQMTMIGYSGATAHGGAWACTKSAAGHHCAYVPY